MTHTFQELGGVVNQVTSNSDSGSAPRIVEVFNSEVAIDGEDPVRRFMDLADDLFVRFRELQLDRGHLLDRVPPVVEACGRTQKRVVDLKNASSTVVLISEFPILI